MDELLVALFDYAVASFARIHGPLPMPVALVALGGYGRGELAPWSDIDVMFLFPAKTKAAQAKPLQAPHPGNSLSAVGLRLKVGHSTPPRPL